MAKSSTYSSSHSANSSTEEREYKKALINDTKRLVSIINSAKKAISFINNQDFTQAPLFLKPIGDELQLISRNQHKSGSRYIRNKYGFIDRHSEARVNSDRGVCIRKHGIDFENLAYLASIFDPKNLYIGSNVDYLKAHSTEIQKELNVLIKKCIFVISEIRTLADAEEIPEITAIDYTVIDGEQFNGSPQLSILATFCSLEIISRSANNIAESLKYFANLDMSLIKNVDERYDASYYLIPLGENAKHISQLTELNFIIGSVTRADKTVDVTFRDLLGTLGKIRVLFKTRFADFAGFDSDSISKVTEIFSVAQSAGKKLLPFFEKLANVRSLVGYDNSLSALNSSVSDKGSTSPLLQAYDQLDQFLNPTKQASGVPTAKVVEEHDEKKSSEHTIPQKTKTTDTFITGATKLLSTVNMLSASKEPSTSKKYEGMKKSLDSKIDEYIKLWDELDKEEQGQYPKISKTDSLHVLQDKLSKAESIEKYAKISALTRQESSFEKEKLARDQELKHIVNLLDILLKEIQHQKTFIEQIVKSDDENVAGLSLEILELNKFSNAQARRKLITSLAITGNILSHLRDQNQFKYFYTKISALFHSELRYERDNIIRVRNNSIMHGDITLFDSRDAALSSLNSLIDWQEDFIALKNVLQCESENIDNVIKNISNTNREIAGRAVKSLSLYLQGLVRLGQIKEGIEIYNLAKSKLGDFGKTLGDQYTRAYIDLLNATSNLFYRANKSLEAFELAKTVLELKEKHVPTEDSYISTAINNVLQLAGQFDPKIIEKYERTISADHPFAFRILPQKADRMFATGDEKQQAEAIKLLTSFIALPRNKNNFNSFFAHISLANFYRELKNDEDAYKHVMLAANCYLASLTPIKQYLGRDFLYCHLQLHYMIAEVLDDIGQDQEAESFLKQAVDKVRFNKDLPGIEEKAIHLSWKLGLVLLNQNKIDESISILEAILVDNDLGKFDQGHKHNVYSNLANAYYEKKQYAKSWKYVELINGETISMLSEKEKGNFYSLATKVSLAAGKVKEHESYKKLADESATKHGVGISDISTCIASIESEYLNNLARSEELELQDLSAAISRVKKLIPQFNPMAISFEQNAIAQIYVSIYNMLNSAIRKTNDEEQYKTLAKACKTYAEELKEIIITREWVNPHVTLKTILITFLGDSAVRNFANQEAIEYFNALTPDKYPDVQQSERFRKLGHAYENIANDLYKRKCQLDALPFYHKACENFDQSKRFSSNSHAIADAANARCKSKITEINKNKTTPSSLFNTAGIINLLIDKIGVVVARQNLRLIEEGAIKAIEVIKVKGYELASDIMKDAVFLIKAHFNKLIGNNSPKVNIEQNTPTVELPYNEAIKAYSQRFYDNTYIPQSISPSHNHSEITSHSKALRMIFAGHKPPTTTLAQKVVYQQIESQIQVIRVASGGKLGDGEVLKCSFDLNTYREQDLKDFTQHKFNKSDMVDIDRDNNIAHINIPVAMLSHLSTTGLAK